MRDALTRLAALTRPFERLLVRAHVSPNALTLASLIFAAAAAVGFATGHLTTGGLLLWLAGLCDVFDGHVARATGTASPAGALLDSVCDRYAELLVFSGLAFHFGAGWPLVLTLAALVGSLMVSYTRARAEALGVHLADVGFMQRPERLILLGAGGILAWPLGPASLVVVLTLIAIGANVTAIVRLRHAFRRLHGAQPTVAGGRALRDAERINPSRG